MPTRRGFLAGSCATVAAAGMTDSVSGQAPVEAETPAVTTETARQSSQNVPGDIESRVRDRVQESPGEHDLAGATVAVVTEGDVTMTDGFGVADRDTERPVEATTPFRIGSISDADTLPAELIDEPQILQYEHTRNDRGHSLLSRNWVFHCPLGFQ